MLTIKQKPIIKRNKFANLTEEDWKESNIVTRKNRGISGLTYKDIIESNDLSHCLSLEAIEDDINPITS